jgi:hypothetical protein
MGTAVGLLFNQLSPKAFAKLPWQYYAVFIGCDAVAAVCFFTIYPETKGKTLEEIAEIFGDTVAFTERIGHGAVAKDLEDKPGTGEDEVYHAEQAHEQEHNSPAQPTSAAADTATTTA